MLLPYPSELAAFMLPHKRGSIKEAKVWAQALYLSWGSLLDAQWNPCLHCFSVSQQNSFWKGKTTTCYTMWPLQSWSKGESQVTGRKLKTIIPISIFVLWKLRSWVASCVKVVTPPMPGLPQEEKRQTAGFANLSLFLCPRKYWYPCL